MDRGAWQVTVHGVTKSHTGLRDYYFIVGADKFKIYWVGQQAGNSGKS